ncbi:effector-associated domain EAD1-containing protein [Luteimonas suaedae]|uniref:GAP1-N1 domain-containing protein n=1 Tax=Luteimonas suaedae TaxID=2605430 RepID=UPI0011EE6256|nr:effector-associated domain EAD1-containing protein [Luteimonas suaedae]
MNVEQAIYGEVRGGHGLRLASDGGGISAALTARLDLPDTAPPGANWSPFLSGFPHGDHYVLARTFADPTAKRAGMVLSHALIVPLDEIVETTDLRPLLALLIATPELPANLETCVVPAPTGGLPEAFDLLPAAAALAERGAGQVVRIGTQGFEELVVALWFHFWPELRASFAFRLSFTPQDLVEMPKPALVCTPTSLAIRWTGHRVIGIEVPATVSRAAKILSGGFEPKPVLNFAREIGACLDRFSDFPLLLQAYDLAGHATPKLDECISTIRLVDRLSPDPSAGSAGKTKVLMRLLSRLGDASVRDVLLLRNLNGSGFPAMRSLWAALENWAAKNSFLESDDEDMLSIFDNVFSPVAAVEAWRSAITRGITTAVSVNSESFSAAFWRWAHARPATLAELGASLPRDHDLEARLSEIVPEKISLNAAQTVRVLGLSKDWMRLHGAAVGASLAPRDAVLKQLEVDTDSKCLEGVKAALRLATPSQKIALALELVESRVVQIAAEEVARKPKLLKDIDFTSKPAQELWARALAINAEAWKGPADPQRSFSTVIEMLLDSGQANAELIAALAKTPVADLNNHPRRIEVWQSVNEPVRTDLLKTTAAGWLERAVADSSACAPEPCLEAAILDGESLDRQLRALTSNGIGTAIRIMAVLPNHDEARFIAWLDVMSTMQRSLATADAEAIGRLVLDRRWRKAVDSLVQLVRNGRQDVKQALRICRDMISIWDAFLLGLSPITNEEKWHLLQELLIDLYPAGPNDNELWSRAGGQVAELQTHGNGKSQWRDAVSQVRRGKRPRLRRLLREISDDYPANDRIRYLENDRYFF